MYAIKAVVIIMAVLIVVGIVAVVWAMFNLNSPARDGGSSNVAELTDKLSLRLPAGCEIAGMELDGDHLAVRTEGSRGDTDCERIYIVDLASGEVISTLAR